MLQERHRARVSQSCLSILRPTGQVLVKLILPALVALGILPYKEAPPLSLLLEDGKVFPRNITKSGALSQLQTLTNCSGYKCLSSSWLASVLLWMPHSMHQEADLRQRARTPGQLFASCITMSMQVSHMSRIFSFQAAQWLFGERIWSLLTPTSQACSPLAMPPCSLQQAMSPSSILPLSLPTTQQVYHLFHLGAKLDMRMLCILINRVVT